MKKPATWTALAVATSLAAAPAQMEKRWSGQFDGPTFAAAAPAVGSPAPNLELCDLEGRPRCLLAELGRTVVIVKGSFT